VTINKNVDKGEHSEKMRKPQIDRPLGTKPQTIKILQLWSQIIIDANYHKD